MGKYLAGLTPDQWNAPSACDLWEVRDVVAHLIGGVERQMDSLDRGMRGDSAPPPGFAPLPAEVVSTTNAQRDIERRQGLGEGLLEVFRSRYDQLRDALAGISGDQWEAPCWHHRRGTLTAREYVDLRIQELAIHDWDLRSGLEPEAQVDPESALALLDIAPAWLGMTFRPGAPLGRPLVYRWEISGSNPHRFDLMVLGDSFRIQPPVAGVADVVVKCSADAYVLLVYGRLTAQEGVASGRLAIDGEAELMRRFESWFKGL
jgi:uncharacterized protein (TIGR03083 family)